MGGLEIRERVLVIGANFHDNAATPSAPRETVILGL